MRARAYGRFDEATREEFGVVSATGEGTDETAGRMTIRRLALAGFLGSEPAGQISIAGGFGEALLRLSRERPGSVTLELG